MKNKTGLIISIIGVLIILAVVIYQAKTGESALLFIPFGLALNIIGLIIHVKQNKKP
ncbi:hypothetical protein Q2T40_07425 [Winogradskyella maritima]|uniref:Uncharacterized protein n=1 Tax=Winogradskyella maritima TaxID=1517766 RepID=A0ABV8ANU7_9FLAO|nr:hypothetical protein [Winogradskyella maritima]